MAMKKNKRLGSNPLSSSIFSKTDSPQDPSKADFQSLESRTLEASEATLDSRVLSREQSELRGTNVRLPIKLIDWVDNLVKSGSRDKNKSRIPKEVWFQASLELFQLMPVDWDEILDEDQLREVLKSLESRLKNL